MVIARDICRLEIPWRDPVRAFAPIAEQPWSLGFFSSGEHPLARWSVLCADPEQVIIANGPDALEKLELPAKVDTVHDDLPFCGGLAGMLSYDFGLRLQNINSNADSIWPDLAFGSYSCCAVFDHKKQQAWVIGPDMEKATRFSHKLGAPDTEAHEPDPRDVLFGFCADETDEHIAAKVLKVINYIKNGDIFQANISRKFTAMMSDEIHPYHLFQEIISLSQAPFCASFRLDESRMVLSNSPERFLKLTPKGQVETRPIKGTRARGANRQQDMIQRKELQHSAKDRAENLMIVDLMRNDLSRVCKPGSVKVSELFAIQSFSNVHHLVSTIRGQLQENANAVDLLAASFPPGSITGAPKIRAMQIINELEQVARGAYCGALGFISKHGAMDFNVLIRTLQMHKKQGGWAVDFRAGGGIVADSVPQAEAQEMSDKASIFTKLAGGDI